MRITKTSLTKHPENLQFPEFMPNTLVTTPRVVTVVLKNQMGRENMQTTIGFYLRFAPSQLVAAHRTSLQLQMIREPIGTKSG